MAKQFGLVIRTSAHGLTEVLTERHSACGGCQTSHGCKSCLTSSKIKAKVNNPVNALPGDVVEIHLAQRALAQSAAILYGLPLVGLIVGAILGAGPLARWFSDPSTAAAAAGILGLTLGLVLAVMAGNSAYAKKNLVPTIVRVVTPAVPFR